MSEQKGSRHRPWFPFFASDFLSSTRRWSTEEIGCYLLLLSEQWINEDVPTNIDELARIHPDIPQHWETKLKKKFPAGRNPRLEEIREDMLDRSNKNRIAALRRWGRDPENEENAIADANAHADADANADASGYAKGYANTHAKPMHKGMLSTPIPTPIQKPKSKPKTKTKNKPSMKVTDAMWKKFCDVYPKRLGPDPNKNARAKAERCLRTGAQWSDIMNGLRRYKTHCEQTNIEPQFIMRKESFLNPTKEFWQSEYAQPENQSQGTGVDNANWNSRNANPQPVDVNAELIELGSMMGMQQADDEDRQAYLDRVKRANEKRLANL